jgi:hypothetical protein
MTDPKRLKLIHKTSNLNYWDEQRIIGNGPELCRIRTCVANEGDVIGSHLGDSRSRKTPEGFLSRSRTDARKKLVAHRQLIS